MNRVLMKRLRGTEPREAVKLGRRYPSKGRPWTSPHQRYVKDLPGSERAGVGDDHTADRLLPAPGPDSPQQFLLGHEPERGGSVEHAIASCEQLIEIGHTSRFGGQPVRVTAKSQAVDIAPDLRQSWG